MMRRLLLIAAGFLLLLQGPARADGGIAWAEWTDQLFARAQAENRFVILDLGAVWCHWCHVMDEKTYGDAAVAALIGQSYLAVKVDQDSRPDLSSRYGDWGWPATIIFAPDGTEIVKARGYIPPENMAALLQAVIDDPSPGPSVSTLAAPKPSASPYLSDAQKEHLRGNYDAVYDAEFGGWGQRQKYIDADMMTLALSDASRGIDHGAEKARQTLNANLALIDPEWGGIYQYSDKRDWSSPHFEKIMTFQSDTMRLYAEAYRLWHDPAYLKAVRDIDRYLKAFMTAPGGAFYTSQDADVGPDMDGHAFYALSAVERAKLPQPRIDTNIYSRDNGLAIRGLVALYTITADRDVLARAERAADWILSHRQRKDGGFDHGDTDHGTVFLADTLAMGQAALDLYAATGMRKWLAVASAAGSFIGSTFKHPEAGFVTSGKPAASHGVFTERFRQIEENIQTARFLNLLSRYTGQGDFRAMSDYAMHYLTSDDITGMRRFLAGLLVNNRELSEEPVHITIVGAKADPNAIALHQAALAYPGQYKRIDWWDRAEGPMENPDIAYPDLDQAAAFACFNNFCSQPVYEPAQLDQAVRRMRAEPAATAASE